MSRRLRGPPKPRDEAGPDPIDARTFVTFVAMMLVISVVIVGIGGILHGFPTFSGPAEPDGADAGDGDLQGEANGDDTPANGSDTDPIFGDGNGDTDDGGGDDRNESDSEG